jgi:hypothetical protein
VCDPNPRGRQKDFVDAEKALGRTSPADISSLVGYAAGKKVCTYGEEEAGDVGGEVDVDEEEEGTRRGRSMGREGWWWGREGTAGEDICARPGPGETAVGAGPWTSCWVLGRALGAAAEGRVVAKADWLLVRRAAAAARVAWHPTHTSDTLRHHALPPLLFPELGPFWRPSFAA